MRPLDSLAAVRAWIVAEQAACASCHLDATLARLLASIPETQPHGAVTPFVEVRERIEALRGDELWDGPLDAVLAIIDAADVEQSAPGAVCATCVAILAADASRHFKECVRRADYPKASTDPCPHCNGSGRVDKV